jgi:hypothetical protein
MRVKSWIRIRIKVEICTLLPAVIRRISQVKKDLSKSGEISPLNKLCMSSRVVDPDPHYFGSSIRIRIRVKSWIRIRIKVEICTLLPAVIRRISQVKKDLSKSRVARPLKELYVSSRVAD